MRITPPTLYGIASAAVLLASCVSQAARDGHGVRTASSVGTSTRPIPAAQVPAGGQSPLAMPSLSDLLAQGREAVMQGRLEKASTLFELASAGGARFDRSDLIAVLSELGDWDRVVVICRRIGADAAASAHERDAAKQATERIAVVRQAPSGRTLPSTLAAARAARLSGAWLRARELSAQALKQDSGSPEIMLEAALDLQESDAIAARRLFDRSRIAFEHRESARATAEMLADLNGNISFAEDSRNFAVISEFANVLAMGLGYDLWSIEERRVVRRVRVPRDGYLTLLSPDGTWFATEKRVFGPDGKVAFQYDTAEGLSFTPDSKALLVSGGDGKVRRFATDSGKLLSQSNSGFDSISWCGKTVVVQHRKAAQVRSALDRPTIHSWNAIRSTCVGSDMIATSEEMGPLSIYSQPTGRLLHRYDSLVNMSGGGEGVITASSDGRLLTWFGLSHPPVLVDTRSWQVLYGTLDAVRDSEEGQSSAAIAPDGSVLAQALFDGEVRVRPLPSLAVAWQSQPQAAPYTQAETSPDGSLLAAARGDRILIFSLNSGSAIRLLASPLVADLKWISPQRLAVWSSGLLQVLDAATGRIERSHALPKIGLHAYTSLLLSTTDLIVRDEFLRASVFVPLDANATPKEISGVVVGVSTSGTFYAVRLGTNLVVHSRDETVIRPLSKIEHEAGWTEEHVFSPDTRFIVRRTTDGLLLWNIAADHEERRFLGATQAKTQRFSADGSELGVLSADDVIRVYAVSSGLLVRHFSATDDAGKDALWLGRSGWRAKDRMFGLFGTDNKQLLELVADRDSFAGFLRTPEGQVESLDLAQPPPLCAIGTARFPWQLCEGRLTGHDLLLRTERRDPLLGHGL